jgi:hypothetical protein
LLFVTFLSCIGVFFFSVFFSASFFFDFFDPSFILRFGLSFLVGL